PGTRDKLRVPEVKERVWGHSLFEFGPAYRLLSAFGLVLVDEARLLLVALAQENIAPGSCSGPVHERDRPHRSHPGQAKPEAQILRELMVVSDIPHVKREGHTPLESLRANRLKPRIMETSPQRSCRRTGRQVHPIELETLAIHALSPTQPETYSRTRT